MKLANRRIVYTNSVSTLPNCVPPSPLYHPEPRTPENTHRLRPQPRPPITRDHRLLKALHPKIIRIPQPHKSLACRLDPRHAPTQLEQQLRVVLVGSLDLGQRRARHALHRVGQAAVLCPAVRGAEEEDGGGREEDVLEGAVAFGGGEAEELPRTRWLDT